MIYNDFQDLKLSALGVGTMRLPVINGVDMDVDEKAAIEMIDRAMEKGVNYYDTAYAYHGGNSELVTGKALEKYPRDSFYLADKFPGYNLSNIDKVEAIFEEQLKKCRVEYFDFYLFHNVYEKNVGPYTDEKYGIMDYLRKQKKNGRIRHLGFSCHGSYDVLKQFLDVYGSEMEFCQLQINYVDWTFQDAKRKVELLKEHNIPVWVMEPLRGGSLAKLSEENTEKLKAIRPEETVPAWALRFLQTIPEVTVTLSGMSNMQQLMENIATFDEPKPLSDEEFKTLLDMADEMLKKQTLPCTACHYCVEHCPQGLDIPMLLSLYNEHVFSGGGFIAPMALSALPDDKKPSACIGCGSCEAVCPQQLKISEAMSDFVERLKRP